MMMMMMDKLQAIQNRAARIVINNDFDTSAAPLIQKLGCSTVKTPIYPDTPTMAFKCLNNSASEYLSGCLSKLSDCHNHGLRNSKTDLLLPRMRPSYGQKSFAYRGAEAWNQLDFESKFSPSIHCCKSRLKTYKGL